jgi:hypothetical protein
MTFAHLLKRSRRKAKAAIVFNTTNIEAGIRGQQG